MPRLALALLAAQLVAATALADNPAELGRAHGGALELIPKQSRKLSGSLGFSQSSGAARGAGYEATLGGEIVEDRLWFFAAASMLPRMDLGSNLQGFDAKVMAQPADWQSITASYRQNDQTLLAPNVSLPSSFLSLRSESMLSDNMLVSFSFSRTQR